MLSLQRGIEMTCASFAGNEMVDQSKTAKTTPCTVERKDRMVRGDTGQTFEASCELTKAATIWRRDAVRRQIACRDTLSQLARRELRAGAPRSEAVHIRHR
jgi:hypothetical protein